MSKPNAPFKRKLLATAITLATATTAQAGLVRADVDYQYYRDFGENKGLFRLNGDTPVNAEIVDKQGKSLGTVLEGVPMIDLAVGSRGDGIATLVDPQYVVSVQHNVGYQTVQFGDHSSNNLDSHHFDYQVTDRHLKAPGVGIGSWHRDDYHSPRLHKLVTEVAPISIANETHIGAYLDKEKYPVFVRSGGGTQRALEQPGNVEKDVAGPYLFVTGGEMLDLIEVVADSVTNIPGNSKQTLMRIKGFDDLHNHPLGIMQRRGDSGSGVFAWDAQAKRWVYAMSVQSSTPSQSFSIAHLGFMEENRQKAIAGEISATGKTLNWTPTGNTSTITGGDTPLTVGLYDPALLERDGEKNAQGVASSQWHRPRQNAGKTFTITGDDNVLKLTNNVNQGSGAIYFKGNTTVEGATANTTWLGAGVSVDKDKTVTWKVHNPDQDRLSKIGEGTLLVQGTGKNMGSISVGDGKVILDQKADANNQKQAFDEVGIVSGRPTVVLNSSDQVNPDSIYFGFRGGRLDVNGNDLTFNRIQNADSGARIVNHNMTDSAKVTLNRTKNFSSSGEVPFETNRRNTHTPVGFYAAPRADGTTDYFVLKEGRTPNVSFPDGKFDGRSWTYLASGTKQDAIRAFLELKKNDPLVAKKDAFFGFLGETDNSKNGRLDVEYNPTLKDDLYILNGGSNLNGTLAVKNGTLMLSGIPVPHAYDHLNNKDVVKDDEWIDRHFTASNFQVTGGTLATSRNVGSITGDINASEQGRVNLGVVNGETENCYRSDYSGVVHCSATAIADNLIVPVNVKGTATASDTAHIQIANANIVGNVRASNQATVTIKDNVNISNGVTLTDTAKLNFANSKNALTKVTGSRHSQVNMQAGSHWQLADNSTVGQLTGEQGSQISLTATKPDTYQQLTVNGDLFGNLTFNMATDLAQGKADKLIVNGYANGSHQLAVQNTGNEAKVDELTLVELRHGAQESGDAKFALVGGEVHAGALRYTLETDASNRYFLYNPTKADELAKQRQAEAEKARQAEEQAKKDLADAIKARQDAEEAKKRAEDALAQAQTGSGITPEQLAQVQKLADDAKKLAEQATAEKAQAERALATARSQLDDANNAKAEAERLKAEADRQAQTARDEQTRLQTALDNANLAKQTAEQEKETAQNAQKLAEQQAETASREKEQAEAKQREAESKQQQAETQKTEIEAQLAEANRLKANAEKALLDAQADGGKALSDAQKALADAQKLVADKEQALNQANLAKTQAETQKAEAERQKNDAQNLLNQAQQDLTTANALKDQAEKNLADKQTELDKVLSDKQTAETKAREAQNKAREADEARQALENTITAQTQALEEAERAKTAAEEAKRDAEKARDDAQKALDELRANSSATATDLANAQKRADEAEKARQDAEEARQAAADALTTAQNEKRQAEAQLVQVRDELQAAQTAKTEADNQKQEAEAQLATVNEAKTRLEGELELANRAKDAANQAVREKEQALTEANNAKAEAERQKVEAERLKNEADNARQTAEQARQTAADALMNAENEKRELEDRLNAAQNSQTASGQELEALRNQLNTANNEVLAKTQAVKDAETARDEAVEAANEANRQKQRAESNLADAQSALEEANNQKRTAQNNAERANALKDQAEKNLADKQTELDKVLSDKQTAETKAREADAKATVAEQARQALESTITAQTQALEEAERAKTAAEEAQKRAEAEQLKAEEAKIKAEEDKRRAEAEKLKAEEDKAKAEADKLKAEEVKAKAESDKLKAEEDKRRAEELALQAQNAKTAADEAARLADEARQKADADKTDAEAAKTAAEAAQKRAEDAKKLAESALKTAEDEVARQTTLATEAVNKQTEAEAAKTTAESNLSQAVRDKERAEEALRLAQAGNSQDVTALQNQLAAANQAVREKEQALTEANNARDEAERQKQAAETARTTAENERDTALASVQTANNAKTEAENTLKTVREQLAKAESDKLKAEEEKAKAESDRLKAEEEKTRAESEKQKAEAEQLKAEEDKRRAEAEKLKAEEDKAKAEAEKLKAEEDKARAEAERLKAEEDKQKVESEKLKAEAEKDREAELARQAEREKVRAEAETARQTELAKNAKIAEQAALLTAKNAETARQLADEARKLAEDTKAKADEANAALAEANDRLEVAAKADAETILVISAARNAAQKLADERNEALTLAQADLNTKQAELTRAEQQNAAMSIQLQQAETLKTQAEQALTLAQNAQKQADEARLVAIDAKDKSDAERRAAETARDTAEKLAAEKQAAADEAKAAYDKVVARLDELLAEAKVAGANLDVAKAEAVEAKRKQEAAEAENARLRAEAARLAALANASLAQAQKQADVISQYANTALSEVSATAHHVSRIGERIDERLHDLNGKNSGVWLQTDYEKTQHSSDQYRGYEQTSQLTQVGADRTVPAANGELTVGGALSHLSYDADYDDNFTGEGKTTMGTAYTKWQNNNGFALMGDVSAGQAVSKIKHATAQTPEIKRNVASVGVGVAKEFRSDVADVEVYTGLKYHHLGEADYAIAVNDGTQVAVAQDDIGITSLNAGVNIGKTVQTANGYSVRPSVGVNYRHANSAAVVRINNHALTQNFANEFGGQIGVSIGKSGFNVKVHADFTNNNESGKRTAGLVGVSYNW